MNSAQRARGVAFARAALAGNPSDGYGGAVLAVTLGRWWAQVEAVRAPSLSITPASPLVEAAVRRFAQEVAPDAREAAVRWTTSVPRGVGLGGSSALVIATVRALCELHGVELEPDRLAGLALAVETEDLGIVAGLQDRIAQAYEGLTFMDFAGVGDAGSGSSSDATHGTYEPLDPALLPPLLIAWRPVAAAESGRVHATLRRRHADGDDAVRAAMAELGDVARAARAALVAGDHDGLRGCMDRTFDLRRTVIELDARCVEMIEVARACGASANYTGSGGAIVATGADGRELEAAEKALLGIACGVERFAGTQGDWAGGRPQARGRPPRPSQYP